MVRSYAAFKFAIRESWEYTDLYAGDVLLDASAISMLRDDDPSPVEKRLHYANTGLRDKLMSSAVEYDAINVFKKLAQYGIKAVTRETWLELMEKAAMLRKTQFVDFARTKAAISDNVLASYYAMGRHYDLAKRTVGDKADQTAFYTTLSTVIRNAYDADDPCEVAGSIICGALKDGPTWSDPSYNNDAYVRYASACGCTEVVELLLADDRVDPTALNNKAVRDASERGNTAVVRVLAQHYCDDPLVLTDEEIKKIIDETPDDMLHNVINVRNKQDDELDQVTNMMMTF